MRKHKDPRYALVVGAIKEAGARAAAEDEARRAAEANPGEMVTVVRILRTYRAEKVPETVRVVTVGEGASRERA